MPRVLTSRLIQLLEAQLGENHDYTRMVVSSQKNLYTRIQDYESLIEVISKEMHRIQSAQGTNNQEFGLLGNELAMAYLGNGDYSLAFEHYKSARKIFLYDLEGESANYAGITYNIGHAYISANQFEEALAPLTYYSNYLEKESVFDSLSYDYGLTQYYLGYSHYQLGHFADALAPLSSYKLYLDHRDASNHEELANVLFYLGDTLRQLNQYSPAIKSFERALELVELQPNPSNSFIVSLHNSLGLVYKELANYDLAEQYLSEALALNKENDLSMQQTILNNYGLLKMDLGNYEEAEKLFQRSLKLKKACHPGRSLN